MIIADTSITPILTGDEVIADVANTPHNDLVAHIDTFNATMSSEHSDAGAHSLATSADDGYMSSEDKIVVDNINDEGKVNAWISFDGSGTVSINNSFNVSSLVDNGGSGNYTINFTTPFADANYAIAGWCRGGGSTEFFITGNSGDTMTASSAQIKTASGGGSLNDTGLCTLMFIGDQ